MKVSDLESSEGLLPGFLSSFVGLPQLSVWIKKKKLTLGRQLNSLSNQTLSADDRGPC